MKNFILTTGACAALGIAAFPLYQGGIKHKESVVLDGEPQGNRALSSRFPLSTNGSPWLRLKHELDSDIAEGNVARAESRIASQRGTRLDDGRLQEYRARLLLQRGASAEALSTYMSLLRGNWLGWSPSSRNLTDPLELALRLGRSREADEIATWIIAHPTARFGTEGLATPTQARTPAQRLAYANLALSYDAGWNGESEKVVFYRERAQKLAPNDPSVLAQLAVAYHHRHGKGDRETCERLLKKAYGLLPASSTARRELRLTANDKGITLDPRIDIGTDLQEHIVEKTAAKNLRRIPF